MTPLNRRRLYSFRANRRGYWSFWIFGVLLLTSLFAEFIANDRPLLVRYDGSFYTPVLVSYPETEFGGFLQTDTDYGDPEVKELIESCWKQTPDDRALAADVADELYDLVYFHEDGASSGSNGAWNRRSVAGGRRRRRKHSGNRVAHTHRLCRGNRSGHPQLSLRT